MEFELFELFEAAERLPLVQGMPTALADARLVRPFLQPMAAR
jgi:hypothetical protein